MQDSLVVCLDIHAVIPEPWYKGRGVDGAPPPPLSF